MTLSPSLPGTGTFSARLTRTTGVTALVSLALAVMSIAPVGAQASFPDIPSDGAYRDAIDWAAGADVARGTTDPATATVELRPLQFLTRVESAALLHRVADSPVETTPHGFPDMTAPELAWSQGAVNWARSQGVVRGYTGGAMRPTNLVPRVQFLTMLHRTLGSPAPGGSNIWTDTTDPTVAWAGAAIDWAACTGITDGQGERLFVFGHMVRAEALLLIHRATTPTARLAHPSRCDTGELTAPEGAIIREFRTLVDAEREARGGPPLYNTPASIERLGAMTVTTTGDAGDALTELLDQPAAANLLVDPWMTRVLIDLSCGVGGQFTMTVDMYGIPGTAPSPPVPTGVVGPTPPSGTSCL